jgi:HAD superfamily hydrolase (TIGR01509 family)
LQHEPAIRAAILGKLQCTMPARAPTLIFDLGGVLVRHDNDALYDRLAACCKDIAAARPKIESWLGDEQIGTGKLHIHTLYTQMKDVLGLRASYPYFLELWSSHFSEEPGMDGLVERLARRHRTILFSNTNAPHIEHIAATYPVYGRFHATYLSYELGLVKPATAAYERVLELEGRTAPDCIFIDDRPENTRAASELGMSAVTFTGRDDFVAALERHGIAV